MYYYIHRISEKKYITISLQLKVSCISQSPGKCVMLLQTLLHKI